MKILHGSADTEDARPGITEAERAQHVATCRANVVESIAAVLEVGRTYTCTTHSTWSHAAAVQGWAGLGVPLPQHLSEAGQRVRKAVESVTSVTGGGAELTASVYSPHLARDVASLWAEARLQAAAARLSQVGGVEEDCD